MRVYCKDVSPGDRIDFSDNLYYFNEEKFDYSGQRIAIEYTEYRSYGPTRNGELDATVSDYWDSKDIVFYRGPEKKKPILLKDFLEED